MNIECPPSMRRHVQKVLNGEYEIPYQATRPTILDIGANVGSFAVWALQRWPGCHIHCYEPLPDSFDLLRKNLAQVPRESVTLYNFAVGDKSLKRLYLGLNNCGEASFYDIGEQSPTFVEVETKAPSVLPRAHIIKIDTEGSEVDILKRLSSFDYDVIMLEYHSETNRRTADKLVGGLSPCGWRGSSSPPWNAEIHAPASISACPRRARRGLALTWGIRFRTCREDRLWLLVAAPRGCSSVG